MNKFDLQQNVSLAPLTTLGIGGPARYFVRAETEDAVVDAFEFADKQNLSVFVLGGGSNVLVADRGFDGLVLQVAIKGISEPGAVATGFPSAKNPVATAPGSDVTVGAGEDWDQFVAYCVERDLAGIECLSGIPGFVGGTPVQNVGAYGQEVSETIRAVRCLDRRTNEFVDLNNEECGFTYRTSIFNSRESDRYIVLSVTYELRSEGKPAIVYKDLIEYFSGRKPTLAETRAAILNIRRAKSMVIDANDPNSKSAGSFFKNPVVDRDKLNEIEVEFEHVPHFAFGEKVKISAAWLIESSGFYKGFIHGNVGISSNHTLALINRGGGTAAEMIELKKRIQSSVCAKFGIQLHPEPILIGF